MTFLHLWNVYSGWKWRLLTKMCVESCRMSLLGNIQSVGLALDYGGIPLVSQSVMWTQVVHSCRNLMLNARIRPVKLNVTQRQYDNKAKSNYCSKITVIQCFDHLCSIGNWLYTTKFLTIILHQLQQYYAALHCSTSSSHNVSLW